MGVCHSGPDVAGSPKHAKLSQATLDRRDEAIARAAELFARTRGTSFHSNYVRTTLVSYGASCKVLTCVHRATGKRYAAKAIAKVGRKKVRDSFCLQPVASSVAACWCTSDGTGGVAVG
jgi:hypothetical protein